MRRRRGISHGWTLLVIGSLVVCSACATGSASTRTSEATDAAEKADDEDEEAPSEKIEVGPMLVEANDKGEVRKTVDAKEVFDKAYTAYSARRYEEAAEHYKMIVDYFPDSRFYQPSLYNGGLAYEKIERWSTAARMYRTILEDFPDDSNAKDAYYRLAEVYKQTDQHEMIVELMTKLMLREGLEAFDRIEAHARRSNALLEIGQFKQAEQGFENLLEINREASADDRLASDSRYIVQAHFGLGRVHHERLKSIALELPTEKMGEDLDRKGKLLLDAQMHYLDALRQHHPHWSVASGYMIGQMYEDFYSDIFSAEIPDDLNDEQVALYFEELQDQIRPLVKRAIEVYEKNLSLSARIGETPENNQWVAQTSRSLDRMKEFLNNPAAREQARKLVRRGKDFRSLWTPYEEARNYVDEALQSALKKSEDGESDDESAPET